MCAVFLLMTFNKILLSQVADLFLLRSLITRILSQILKYFMLATSKQMNISLQEYILTSHICFGSFYCGMERTGLALVKLVLCIHKYEARLKDLIWCAGPLTAIL